MEHQKNDLFTHIKTLEGHNDCVNKVIPLTTDIIASCSIGLIRVWNTNTYKEETTSIKEDEDVFQICCTHKLKTKDEMIVGGYGQNILWFVNTKTFKKEKSVECCDCLIFNRIIELPNHHIAVNGTFSSTIDIIDTTHYIRIK